MRVPAPALHTGCGAAGELEVRSFAAECATEAAHGRLEAGAGGLQLDPPAAEDLRFPVC